MDALSVIKKYQTPSQSSGYNLTYTPTTNASTKHSGSTGGKRALETAGYFFNKLGLSFMRGIEGIADFTAGGIAELFGNDDYAERQMSTDWMNYNYADEWYKPRNGFEQFMGDLGGGIGSSLPALAAVAIAAGITYLTAGAGATVAVPLIGSVATSTITGSIAAGTTAFLSAGGTAASEAYKETGNLGNKEWGYAAGSGAIEGGTEAVMNLAGLGVGAVGKKLLGKSAGKVVATGIGKTAWNATKNFVSEGVEEVISDAVDPYLRRATIDPNAKNATAQELLYTGIVGGFSSLLMGGGNAMVSKTVDFAKGEKIAANPDRAKSVMAAADEYSNMESKKATGSEVVEEIAKQNAKLKELMNKNSLSPFDKAKISELLGSLERLETIALFDKMAVGETMSILSNPDAFAKTIPNGVYIDPEGNKHTVTKETLTKGIVYKDGKADGRSISKAIKTNGTLRAIVAARVAGTVLADAGAVYTSMLEGNKFFNTNDELNEFYENATPETRERVKNEMGIDMEIDNIETVNQKLALWKMSGAGEQYKANLGVVRKAKALEVTENELPMMPTKVKLAVGESKRYADGTYDIAITRDTEGTYTIVDINEGRSISGLSRDKLNEAINTFRKASIEESTNASTNATNKADEATKADRKVSETDAKNEAMYERISNEVKGYDGLSAPNKRAVRSMVRKAIRLGVSDEYIVSSARYMTVTGINLQFVPNSAFTESGVNGMYRYSDGTVYLNAEINQKTFDELVVHETSHALYKSSPKLKKVIDKLAKGLTEEQKREIHKTYSGVLKGKTLSERADIASDEFGAHYLEYILGKEGMLNALLSEDGSISENLSSVIDKTSKAFKDDKHLYPATKRVFKAYKKALAQFSESNANMNAYADVLTPSDALGLDDERYNLGSAATHKEKLTENYNAKESTVPLDTLQKRYDSILKTWKEIGGELNSEFLAEWDAKKGTDAAFTIFKEQSGYKYNIELSTMCKKGLSLFEAIDTIVRKEMTKKLDSSVITKEDKEILYDVLKSKGYEIPCAICYVEQARQREGVIIDAFLNGNKSSGKLGWNSVLKSVEEKMANAGVKYTFPALDRTAATDGYSRDNFIKGMTVDEQNAFYEALREITNEEVKRYNKANKKDRAPLKDTKPATVTAYFKGSIPANFKLLKVLFNNPKSRFTIDEDLLYSSHTTRNLATYYGDLYSLFNAQSGVEGYKLKQSPIIYTGEILTKKWAPSTLRKNGAIRNQSNSDMQMYTLLDQVQMYIDLTAKGYYLHAYTKVVAELKLLGLSNAKINASLIPQIKVYYDASGNVDIAKTMETAGLDEHGELMFDDFEGINHKEAFMLLSDPEYSKSLCGICIGYSDKHILKMLDDHRIQLIIGFHDKTNNIDKRYKGAKYAKNYNGQNEAYDTVNVKTKHLGFSKFLAEAEKLFKRDKATESFSGEAVYDGKTYTADDIPRLAAKMYLDECKAKGYIPAYGGRGQGNYDFTTHPNYYKLLGDFGLYNSEGHYAPLKKVAYKMPDTVPILNEDGSVSRMDTKQYVKKELQGELEVRDRLSRDLADTSSEGILQKFVAEKNKKVSTKISVDEGRGSLTASDINYLDAVKRGDMVTAQRMVDEAAKKAGYSTEHLYHGTSMFGFTNIDVSSASDDSISFFATNRQEVASGYMPWYEDDASDLHHDDVRRIGVPDKSRPRGLSRSYSAERILTEAQKVFPEYKDARVATDDEVLADLKTYWLTETIEAAEKLRETELSIGSNKLRQQVRDMCDAVIAASKEDTLDAWKAVGNRYKEFDSIDIPYDATDMRPQIFRSRILGGLQQIGKFAKTTAIMIDGKLTSTAAIVDSYNSFLGGETLGMYDLYTKQGNQLVIQGRGSSWNQLPLGKFEVEYMEWLGDKASEELSGKRVTTRDVAAFAKSKGYRSVAFYDIYDNGAYGSAADISDVYAFFHPNEDVKSADPVTYDDKGNVIPLSKRFNPKNEDIRYSLSTPSSTPSASTPKFVDPARRSAVLTSTTKQYKPTWWDLYHDQVVKSQMAFTNTQAGLERLMREVGYTREEAEAQVQFARLGYSQASSIIGGKFIDVSQSGAKNLKVVGKGLSETLAPILPKKFTKNPEKEGYSPEEERYLDLQMLMLHKHNLDRMGLEAKAKKQYLPLEAIGDRLGKNSHKLGEAIKDIGKWQAQIEVYENDIKEAKDKANADADFIEKLDLNTYIEERTTKINNLRKNIDRAVNALVKANDATKLQDMLTMDEAMLKSLADAKYSAEDIDALVGNQAAVLAPDDINTLASLSSITDPIEKLRAIKRIVDRYARMLDSSIESLKAIKNKPLLGKTITVKKIDPNTGKEANVEEVVAMTADESRDIIKEYEKHYKDDKGFWEAETNIREYLDNLMQLRVNSGLVTAELANDLSAMYPNYVPGYRIDASSGLMVVKGSSALELNKGVAKAKGSIKPIRPFHESLAEQTISAVRSARLNEIMVDIYERHKASNNPNKEKHFKIVETVPLTAKGENVTAAELYDVNYADPAQKPKDNQITFYYKGEKITAEVSKDVFIGFEDLAGRRKMLLEGTLAGNMLDFIMGGFRTVTINWNPTFIARNFSKDLWDALITSNAWAGKYARKYASTLADIKKNSELWQLYVASGGLGNSFVDEKQKRPKDAGKRGFEKISANANPVSWLGALGQTVENANKFVEQLPRFAAFKIALESGASVAQAMNEAAEITTNFQRGGTVTRFFNKIIPFLNASVQGFFKYPRRIIKAFGSGEWDKVIKQLALLLFNAVLIGIVPMVINELLCKDVEGYEELRNTDKENYYLIPMGDGQFVKIPRGRIQAAMSSVTNLAMGKSTVSETMKNVSSQVSPWGTMTRTIFSPIKDVSTNTTWYGGEIEGMQFEGIRPGARYDEGTSWLAKKIGGVLDYSPKKIDYLLGQYTGFFGDVILDATNQKANGNPLVTNFTVDSVTSNRLSNDFYEYYNEAQFAKNEGNETAIYQLKYLNKIKKQVRELYDQKSAIQSNSALSNKEKLEQTRILQSYINGLYAAAIDQFATVTDATEATSGYGLEENDRFREVIRISFGAEAALESWDEDVYAGAKLIEKSGVDFEKYYDFYFAAANIDSDKDKNGNTVSGSKRAKVKKLVTEMDISAEQKVLLLASKGYSVKDGEFRGWTSKNYKSKLLRYIFSLSISKEEKAELAELCGFKVVNGRVIS